MVAAGKVETVEVMMAVGLGMDFEEEYLGKEWESMESVALLEGLGVNLR